MLLDECLPRRLGARLTGHIVSTVAQAGWAGVSNGELLSRVEGGFDAFITIDANLPAQQRLDKRSFGVVLISAKRPSGFLEPLGLLLVFNLRPSLLLCAGFSHTASQ